MPPAADVPNVLTPEQGYEATYRFVAQYYERERIVPLMLMLMPLLDLSTLIGRSSARRPCHMPGQRRLSTGPDRTLRRPSGAVSGGSTVLSGLFRRRTPVSEDLCL